MTLPLRIDPKLKEWATDKQRELIELIDLHGSASSAARVLGVNKSYITGTLRSLKKRAAQQGYAPDHDMTRPVPDGFKVKGVSTYYDRDGEVRGQWVKSTEDAEARQRLLEEFVTHLMERARGVAAPSPAPEATSDDLLAVYCFGDPHFGLRAIASEAGEDFDLPEADRITRAAVDRLAAVAPASRKALLLNAGDSTHADNSTNRTRKSGNVLDVDGRQFQAVMVSAKAWVYAAEQLLLKHQEVVVWILPGNHDDDTSFAIAMAIAMYFEREPRITVEVSPSRFRYLRFGKVLIGANHGDGPKPKDMPLIMATDRPEDWGATVFKFIYVGHIHHDTVVEVQGVRVETLRTLAARDAWSTGAGHRAMRDTRVIVHHRDFGEIERHTVSAAMLAA